MVRSLGLPPADTTELASDVMSTLRIGIVVTFEVALWIGNVDIFLVHDIDERANGRTGTPAVRAVVVNDKSTRR